MHPQPETLRHELRLWPLAGPAVLFGMAYVVCAATGRYFSSPILPFVCFWLPSGLFVATLLRQDSRHWPVFAAAGFLANLGFDLAQGQALAVGLLFATGNCLEALAGAWLVRRWVARDPDLSTARQVGGLVGFAAVLSPTLSATVGALAVTTVSARASFAEVWPLWWSGDLLGVVLVAPLILGWRKSIRWWNTWPPTARQIEGAGLVAIVCAVSLFSSFGWVHSFVPLKYLVVPCVLWAAFRFGLRATASISLAVAMISAWSHARGYSFITASHLSPLEQIVFLQMVLAMVALTGAFLCGILEERRQAQEYHRQILQTSIDPFLLLDAQGRLLDANPAAGALSGYTREALLAMSIADLEANEGPGDTAHQIQRTRESGTSRFESRYRCQDGRRVEVEVSLNRLPGDPARWFVFLHDVTARKQGEELIQAQLDELKRWQNVMLDREDRVQQLKREVNALCRRLNETEYYPSQHSASPLPTPPAPRAPAVNP